MFYLDLKLDVVMQYETEMEYSHAILEIFFYWILTSRILKYILK